jgi:hypothetical protein
MLVLLLLACQSEPPAPETVLVADAPPSCPTITGAAARDLCYTEAIAASAPADWPAVGEMVAAFHDPVLRGAALFAWMRTHLADLPLEAKAALCGSLTAPEQKACGRRFQAAHLNR